ncbi:LPS export ABC transporter periplasmic protein LptC [Novosphingobium mangrovi (ex Huang et al. 2023)]|uniref:LPS export ABC transporter periplasmic protein LptC n=1 Tax=Novosphingobium mangrovi (ex Huang et al. 2023) TaxID=2976432 RepID=A0ABT2I9X7_9SPHN|nr:LPS export ABC transporter periplasmic protein LptC [Novosphingobium mangrovi (ex Huang et al. 2023)]MCT2401601.1 LPS export ABC transporter periplasmic protein LptC [Novosphingobium mangrovi (ex Huang et al. 2023)]
MSVEAIQIRNRRRHFAAPGGSHDRLVAFLAKALPAAIGVVAAVMILVPLSPRGEISFLLDRNKVAVTNERLKLEDASYIGQDDHGRDFVVTAGTAVQKSAATPIVEMLDLSARMDLNDGPARIAAPRGAYNYDTEKIDISGPVQFDAPDGYRMSTSNVAIDVKKQVAVGSGGVEGSVPTGTFRAESMKADLENRTVTLEGNARLHMTPGKLRIPK